MRRNPRSTRQSRYALLYRILIPAVCFILGMFLMRETKHMSIWKEEHARA